MLQLSKYYLTLINNSKLASTANQG